MSLIQILFETCKIDVCRLYPNASHEPLRDNFMLGAGKGIENQKLVYLRILKKTLWRMVTTLRSLFISNSTPLVNIDNKVVYVWQTANQRTSLEPIKKASGRHVKTATIDNEFLLPFWRSWKTYVVSWMFFPCCLIRFLQTKGYQRKTFGHLFAQHLHAYGFYFRLRRWMRRSKPAAIVVSNDHIQIPCVMVAAAKASNIPTFYVQHACVTQKFPPLSMDYALLDGLDAAQKYQAAGESLTEIYLIGPTRLDGYTNFINQNSKVESIGVCFSVADEETRIFQLLKTVAELDGFRVVVRPHYRMAQSIRDKIYAFTLENGFEFSIHKQVPALDFMKSLDLLIAGVSAITMEAAMLNLTLANYELNAKDTDWYEFAKNGLVKPFNDLEKLKQFILANRHQRQTSRELAKRYASSLNTDHDGNSAAIAATIINSIASETNEISIHKFLLDRVVLKTNPSR